MKTWMNIVSIIVLCFVFASKVNAETYFYEIDQTGINNLLVKAEKLQECILTVGGQDEIIFSLKQENVMLQENYDLAKKGLETSTLIVVNKEKEIKLMKDREVLVEKQYKKDVSNAKRTGFIWGFGGGTITTFLVVLAGILLL